MPPWRWRLAGKPVAHFTQVVHTLWAEDSGHGDGRIDG
jgi:hypothetical protein